MESATFNEKSNTLKLSSATHTFISKWYGTRDGLQKFLLQAFNIETID